MSSSLPRGRRAEAVHPMLETLPRPVAPNPALRISVVIPTCQRPHLLERCLDALLAQRFEPEAFEIVVVDDGHSATTQALVDAMACAHRGRRTIRCLRPALGRGPAVARNVGWRDACADVIAFTDDDTISDPDWLAHGERALHDKDVAALSGQVRVPLESADSRQRRPTDHELMTQGLERAEFVTANAFVRRSALIAVGGFDERFERAWREDSDLQFKLMEDAMPIGRAADAVVCHPVRAERWGVSLRQQKNVFYDALLFKKHPRLYRERILAAPPWDHYAIVALALGAFVFWAVDVPGSALVCVFVAVVLVVALTWRRLRRTSRAPRATSSRCSSRRRRFRFFRCTGGCAARSTFASRTGDGGAS